MEPLDPSELGLSESLRKRLSTWAAAFSNLADVDFEWASPQEELRFKVAGFRLAADLQEELGVTTQVLYRHGWWSAEHEASWRASLPASPDYFVSADPPRHDVDKRENQVE